MKKAWSTYSETFSEDQVCVAVREICFPSTKRVSISMNKETAGSLLQVDDYLALLQLCNSTAITFTAFVCIA